MLLKRGNLVECGACGVVFIHVQLGGDVGLMMTTIHKDGTNEAKPL